MARHWATPCRCPRRTTSSRRATACSTRLPCCSPASATAEELFCDDITTGASNDLERATKLAREMVTRYGMSEELGTQVFGEAQHEVFLGRDYAQHNDYAAETAKRIDDEVEHIMREAHARAREVLEGCASRPDGDHGRGPAPARDRRGRGRERAA